MSRNVSSYSNKFTALLLGLFALFAVVAANAQTVFLTFSGGSGTPVVISWSTPISYTLTSSTSSFGVNPYFYFQNITGISTAVPVDTVGAIPGGGPTYTSTGAGSGDGLQTINSYYTTNPHGVITNTDLVFRATADTTVSYLTAGDVISLTAGHLTNNNNYFGALPANGFYNTFITDASYQSNLGSGTAIPEPSTYAALVGLGALGFVMWRRRRAAAVAATS
ncbi:MAG: PEP-CTERM sorting domain-containing protein [Candidatus Didemnitutus sp.]|nr:PEP-CTERM sorting domain-containing protein [Candidatus Didemnitutus sp.]